MNFKSADQLIARVSKTLNSYQASGLLDEGDFYRWIKEILAQLNIPAYSVVHRIISVEDYKYQIPEDVYKIWALYRYNVKSEYKQEKHLQNTITTRISEYSCIDECGDVCDLECHPAQKYLVTKNYATPIPYVKEYENGALLKLKNYKLEMCDKESPSIYNNSLLEVSMDSNHFYFNFEKGSVYIQYFRMLLDENGIPMIPDVVQIEKAIETYIIFRFFQELYYNTTADVLQRMQYSELQYTQAYSIARSWVKLPSAKSLIEYGKLLRSKYKVFQV